MDNARQKRFKRELNPSLKVQVVGNDYVDFQHMVDKDVLIEDSRRELDESRKRKMIQHGVHQNQLQRARTNAQQPFCPNNSSVGFRTPTPVSHAGNTGISNVNNNNNNQSQRNNNHGAGVTCFNCHEKGHYANKCPHKQGPTPIPFNLGATPARSRKRTTSDSQSIYQDFINCIKRKIEPRHGRRSSSSSECRSGKSLS